jgi:transcriptional regulator with XRE-family HTH domain
VSTIQSQFGAIIRRRRQELGLGQEPFADKAGLHRTHISLLERGLRMPSLLVIKKLAAGLETTMAELMRELEAATETPPAKKGKPPANKE